MGLPRATASERQALPGKADPSGAQQPNPIAPLLHPPRAAQSAARSLGKAPFPTQWGSPGSQVPCAGVVMHGAPHRDDPSAAGRGSGSPCPQSAREDGAAPPLRRPSCRAESPPLSQGKAAPGSWPRPRLINCCYFKGSETIFLNLSSPRPGASSKGNVSLIKKGTTEEALNVASASLPYPAAPRQ